MLWYRRSDGTERFWIEEAELEALMERELSRARLFPSAAAPAVDIERFVEFHLGADLDQYAELPPAILGVTSFRTGESPQVSLDRKLTEAAWDQDPPQPGAQGRWRATLAHEAAHLLLHAVLFERDAAQSLLFDSPAVPGRLTDFLVRCPRHAVSFGRARADWREVQANLGMAALLMPRRVFAEVAELARTELALGPAALQAASAASRELAYHLASRFHVSGQAAGIRMQTLNLVRPKAQGLLLESR